MFTEFGANHNTSPSLTIQLERKLSRAEKRGENIEEFEQFYSKHAPELIVQSARVLLHSPTPPKESFQMNDKHLKRPSMMQAFLEDWSERLRTNSSKNPDPGLLDDIAHLIYIIAKNSRRKIHTVLRDAVAVYVPEHSSPIAWLNHNLVVQTIKKTIEEKFITGKEITDLDKELRFEMENALEIVNEIIDNPRLSTYISEKKDLFINAKKYLVDGLSLSEQKTGNRTLKARALAIIAKSLQQSLRTITKNIIIPEITKNLNTTSEQEIKEQLENKEKLKSFKRYFSSLSAFLSIEGKSTLQSFKLYCEKKNSHTSIIQDAYLCSRIAEKATVQDQSYETTSQDKEPSTYLQNPERWMKLNEKKKRISSVVDAARTLDNLTSLGAFIAIKAGDMVSFSTRNERLLETIGKLSLKGEGGRTSLLKLAGLVGAIGAGLYFLHTYEQSHGQSPHGHDFNSSHQFAADLASHAHIPFMAAQFDHLANEMERIVLLSQKLSGDSAETVLKTLYSGIDSTLFTAGKPDDMNVTVNILSKNIHRATSLLENEFEKESVPANPFVSIKNPERMLTRSPLGIHLSQVRNSWLSKLSEKRALEAPPEVIANEKGHIYSLLDELQRTYLCDHNDYDSLLASYTIGFSSTRPERSFKKTSEALFKMIERFRALSHDDRLSKVFSQKLQSIENRFTHDFAMLETLKTLTSQGGVTSFHDLAVRCNQSVEFIRKMINQKTSWEKIEQSSEYSFITLVLKIHNEAFISSLNTNPQYQEMKKMIRGVNFHDKIGKFLSDRTSLSFNKVNRYVASICETEELTANNHYLIQKLGVLQTILGDLQRLNINESDPTEADVLTMGEKLCPTIGPQQQTGGRFGIRRLIETKSIPVNSNLIQAIHTFLDKGDASLKELKKLGFNQLQIVDVINLIYSHPEFRKHIAQELEMIGPISNFLHPEAQEKGALGIIKGAFNFFKTKTVQFKWTLLDPINPSAQSFAPGLDSGRIRTFVTLKDLKNHGTIPFFVNHGLLSITHAERLAGVQRAKKMTLKISRTSSTRS